MKGSAREAFRRAAADEGEARPAGPDWLMTFADTMSLMLGFFVLLLSFSTFDETNFREVSGGVQATFGGQRPPEPTPPEPAAHDVAQTGDAPLDRTAAPSVDALRGSVERWDQETRGAMALRIFSTYRGLEITVPADRVFEADSDRVLESASGLLQFLARALSTQAPDRRLLLVVPRESGRPAAPQFEDAWGLAMARALSARQSLLGLSPSVPPHRVVGTAAGSGDFETTAQLTVVFEKSDVRPR